MRNLTPTLALILGLAAGPALADGFAVRDLTTLAVDPVALLGPSSVMRAEPARLTLLCMECEGTPAVDVLIGRQDDGTEARVRSGETTIADLEAICQASDPSCRLEALEVAPAVGWITTYGAGGSTGVILRDGDLLTVRAIAPDAATARRLADTVVVALAPQVVGD